MYVGDFAFTLQKIGGIENWSEHELKRNDPKAI